MSIMFMHFSKNKISREDIEDGNIRLPLHLTTNYVQGYNYGENIHFFIMDDVPECTVSRVGMNGNGTTNKKVNGCIEYVIKTKKQLDAFIDFIYENNVHFGVTNSVSIEQQLHKASNAEKKLYSGKTDKFPPREQRTMTKQLLKRFK